jgi:hypothetical protein
VLGLGLTSEAESLEDGLTILVQLQLGDDDVGRVNTEGDRLTV